MINGEIKEEDRKRIIKMYSGLANTKYVVPLCKESWEIKAFLDIPNSLFKIVSDLRNIKSLLTYNDHKKIT